MHRLRSKSSIYRFRLAALLLCVKCLLIPASLVLLAYALMTHSDRLALIAMGLVLLAALVAMMQWIVAFRTGCPLCLTPALAKKRCTKHRHARSFLGSHRLRVAISILFKNSFRCPYCHEPTVLEVRQRTRH